VCATSAFLHHGLNTFLDAVGIIPREGNLLKGIQLGAAVISAGTAIFGNGFEDSKPIEFGFAGSGLGLAAIEDAKVIEASTAPAVAKADPILGNFLSLGAAVRDIYGRDGMVKDYNDCIGGWPHV